MAAERAGDLVPALRAALGARLRVDEPLARHTSMRVGGPADVLAMPESAAQLADVLASATTAGVRVTLLGGGSNVLVGDGGIRGVVVKLGRGFSATEWLETAAGPRVRAGAAVQLGRLARAAVARGLAGLEYAEGIPGTVGGALFMNAGAYGGDLSTVVDAVEGIVPGAGPVEMRGEALRFRYRRAELPRGFVVTAVTFALGHDEVDAVRARMNEARRRRLAGQPQGNPSAGSIFKNPNGDFAGRLIEGAGLKGARAGRARISDRHANFIVNEGGARASDVKTLMDVAQREVWERSGVWLEPEVQLVGSW
jgi:UDP-N-acetylmuramate dehydrogenase